MLCKYLPYMLSAVAPLNTHGFGLVKHMAPNVIVAPNVIGQTFQVYTQENEDATARALAMPDAELASYGFAVNPPDRIVSVGGIEETLLRQDQRYGPIDEGFEECARDASCTQVWRTDTALMGATATITSVVRIVEFDFLDRCHILQGNEESGGDMAYCHTKQEGQEGPGQRGWGYMAMAVLADEPYVPLFPELSAPRAKNPDLSGKSLPIIVACHTRPKIAQTTLLGLKRSLVVVEPSDEYKCHAIPGKSFLRAAPASISDPLPEDVMSALIKISKGAPGTVTTADGLPISWY